VIAVRANATILARQPKGYSAAFHHQPSAVPSDALDQRESQSSPNEPDARGAAKASDAKSQLAERLAALPILSLGDLRLEWRRLYRAEPPRLSRDIMMRAIAYRLQEVAYGGSSGERARNRRTDCGAVSPSD